MRPCRLFHDWAPWSEVGEGRKLWYGKDVGALLWQARKCRRCEKVQMREVIS